MIKLPKVIFNDGILEIQGNLVPFTENDDLTPTLEYIQQLFEENDIHLVRLDFKYVNSAGIQSICQILKIILKFNPSINWFYDNEDENLFEIIKLFERRLNKKINKIPK